MSYETFVRFMMAGPKRAPKTWGAHRFNSVEEKAENVGQSETREKPTARPTTVTQATRQEAPAKADYKSAAAGEDWDAKED